MRATIDELRGIIQPGDLHLVWSRAHEECVIWRRTADGGDRLGELPMINRTVDVGEGHWGHCPDGTYLVGAPSDCRVIALGLHFTPLFDLAEDGPMHAEGRVGIGIHGGGTGLAKPYAAHQPLEDTHGCFRVENQDNARLVEIVRETQRAGRKVYFTARSEGA